MNERFELECNDVPTDLGVDRVMRFHHILSEEVDELLDVSLHGDGPEGTEARLVGMADLLGDLVVFVRSEAFRWGIPLEGVLQAIMDSQESKLVDGKAIKDERGKFLKGPNYVPPEPRIREILRGGN